MKPNRPLDEMPEAEIAALLQQTFARLHGGVGPADVRQRVATRLGLDDPDRHPRRGFDDSSVSVEIAHGADDLDLIGVPSDEGPRAAGRTPSRLLLVAAAVVVLAGLVGLVLRPAAAPPAPPAAQPTEPAPTPLASTGTFPPGRYQTTTLDASVTFETSTQFTVDFVADGAITIVDPSTAASLTIADNGPLAASTAADSLRALLDAEPGLQRTPFVLGQLAGNNWRWFGVDGACGDALCVPLFAAHAVEGPSGGNAPGIIDGTVADITILDTADDDAALADLVLLTSQEFGPHEMRPHGPFEQLVASIVVESPDP